MVAYRFGAVFGNFMSMVTDKLIRWQHSKNKLFETTKKLLKINLLRVIGSILENLLVVSNNFLFGFTIIPTTTISKQIGTNMMLSRNVIYLHIDFLFVYLRLLCLWICFRYPTFKFPAHRTDAIYLCTWSWNGNPAWIFWIWIRRRPGIRRWNWWYGMWVFPSSL